MRGAAAEELFAELSRVERAPEELTGRVMGRVGYRPVSGREWTRRWWRRTSVRLAGVGLVAGVLGAAAVVLHERDGRHPDPVTVEAAVVQDVETARGRVAAALAGLRQLVPGEATGVAEAPRTGADEAEVVLPADGGERAATVAAGDHVGPGERDSQPARNMDPIDPLAPGLGPAGFPSGGRAIDRLWSPRIGPAGGSSRDGVDQAQLGPLTGGASFGAGLGRLPT